MWTVLFLARGDGLIIFNFVNLMRSCHLVLMNKQKCDDNDGKYSIWWVNNSICCTLLAPVNKLFSLTWLLWALRSFWRFTLHYITLHYIRIRERRCVWVTSLVRPTSSTTVTASFIALLFVVRHRFTFISASGNNVLPRFDNDSLALN